MEVNEVQNRFRDCVKLKLKVDKAFTPAMVRKLMPSSVTIVYCKISKNYVSLLYSEQARREGIKDVTEI